MMYHIMCYTGISKMIFNNYLHNFMFTDDYIPRTSVSIRSGSVKVAIYTKSDKTVERDEAFFIQIDPSILPVGIFNCITSVQVVILNDDSKLFCCTRCYVN